MSVYRTIGPLVLDCDMKVTTPEISWHERDPIYSVDIQPGRRKIRRLVSGGVDKFVRVGYDPPHGKTNNVVFEQV